MTKYSLSIITCFICGIAFTACNQSGKSASDTSETDSTVVQNLSSDLIYSEINAGQVKSITIGEDFVTKFTLEGKIIFEDEETKASYDQQGRLVGINAIYNEEEDLDFQSFSYDSIYYSGTDTRPMYVDHDEGSMVFLDGRQSYFKHLFYANNLNQPSELLDFVINDGYAMSAYYLIIRYNEFDEFGNWTECTTTSYSYEFDENDPLAEDFTPLYVADTDTQTREDLENQIKEILLKSDKETYTTTRQIEYY